MSVAHPTYFKGLLLNNLSDTKINYKAYYQDMILFGINASTEEDTGSTVQANNEIWYTSTDSATVTPYSASSIGTLVSNVYSDGKGVMTFEEDVTTIGYNAFSGCTTLQTVTLPDSVTSIGNYAIQRCSGLTSVTIPDSVTSIGDGAFSSCSGLTSVTIGSGVTSIGDDAFRYCGSLTSATIPDSVTTIGKAAFQSCKSLTSITIGSGVTSIGNYALYNCSSLTSITAKSTTAPSLGTYTFLSIATGGTLYYPSGSDYSTWLTKLEGYNWTGEEMTE